MRLRPKATCDENAEHANVTKSARDADPVVHAEGKKEHVPGSGAFVQYGVSCPFLY